MPTPKTQIKDATSVLIAIMQDNLSFISSDIIDKVIKNYQNSTESTKYNATKDVDPSGLNAYKRELLTAMAVTASEALEQAIKEVPGVEVKEFQKLVKTLQDGDFEELPADIKRRLKASVDLIVTTQTNDLKKSIFFQYQSDVGGEITTEQLRYDLEEKAVDYVEGPAITVGAGVAGANVVNEVRAAYFFQEDVLATIEAFQFINGDPISLICRSLAGMVFAKNDPNMFLYTPPLHYNCKSYIRPILKLTSSMKIEPLIPRKVEGYSNEQVMKSLQFSEHVKNCTCTSMFFAELG